MILNAEGAELSAKSRRGKARAKTLRGKELYDSFHIIHLQCISLTTQISWDRNRLF